MLWYGCGTVMILTKLSCGYFAQKAHGSNTRNIWMHFTVAPCHCIVLSSVWAVVTVWPSIIPRSWFSLQEWLVRLFHDFDFMFFVLCSCVRFCLVVSCIWFPCLCIMSCCVSFFVFSMSHVSFKFPCVFPLMNLHAPLLSWIHFCSMLLWFFVLPSALI